MMRKLLIVLLCGIIHRGAGSRMRFEQVFHDPLYRHDSPMHNEPVYKREHFFPREPIPSAEHLIPQQNMMRNEQIYGNEPIVAHPPPQQPFEEFISNDQIMPNDQFIRAQPILRRESFIRREPIIRRESIVRSEPVIRTGGIYQNTPVLREGRIFRNEPNPYAVMVSQCSCQDAQNVGPNSPQDTFFQVPQPIQPMQSIQPIQQIQSIQPMPNIQQQPIVAHRIIFPKPVIKPAYPSIVTFPRIQRYVRKSFKPMTENIQFSAPTVQSTPIQDFNSFNSEPVPYSGNFQNQGQQQENTSEPSQTNPVTARSVPNMSNPLTLAQMSSIC